MRLEILTKYRFIITTIVSYITIMSEDFYNIPQPKTTTPTTTTGQSTKAVIVQSTTNNQPIFEFSTILSGINGFLLAWTMFYSVLLVMDFFFYRVKFPDGQVQREKDGVASLKGAYTLWLSYTGYLVLFILYLSFKSQWFGLIFGVFGVIFPVLKIIAIDLPHIPVVKKYAKKVLETSGKPFGFAVDGITKAIFPPKPAPDKKPAPGGDKKK
jgi:hypothetical protein